MNMAESIVDFSPIKRGIQVAYVQWPFRVEILKLEPPVGGTSTTKKVKVEGVQDSSFLFLAVEPQPSCSIT